MNFSRVPQVRKIILSLNHKAGCDDRRFIVLEMALLRLLTGLKSDPVFAKMPLSKLEARKGQCIGTRLILDRREDVRSFLTRMCLFAMARDEDFAGLPKMTMSRDGRFSFKINRLLFFPETEPFFDVFETIPSVKVTLAMDTKKYHIACDPQRMPLTDYYWIQRDGFELKKLLKMEGKVKAPTHKEESVMEGKH